MYVVLKSYIFTVLTLSRSKMESPSRTNLDFFKVCIYSAVARGGTGGAHAPPVFFLKSKNRPV